MYAKEPQISEASSQQMNDSIQPECISTNEGRPSPLLPSLGSDPDQDDPSDLFAHRLASLYIKRSKAAEKVEQWNLALKDANMAVELDPQSPQALEREQAVQYAKMEYDRSVSQTRAEKRDAIRNSIRKAIKDWPPMLINTQTGIGCNREQQELAFENISPFKEYLSSDTTTPQMRRSLVVAMKKYCRYIMLSHAWEGETSVFDFIRTQSLYDLSSPQYIDKLQRFCDVVREAGCYWAWSDTSCMKEHQGHGGSWLEEEPRSTYDWYRHAWRTIVLLRGFQNPTLPVSVKESVWITRSWTIHEYVAARFVWFYTNDWRPYRNLGSSNHKYSPIVVAEIQEATRISPQTLHQLESGLTNVREKLQLAATRHVTIPEDTAYSLCPLFNISIPAKYGEGTELAVGRLLEQIIARSKDVVVLDWIGNSGVYNSCLPGDLRPYSTAQYHVPSPVVDISAYFPELDTAAILLYKRLATLESPKMTNRRLRLPCLAFRVELKVVEAGVYHMKIRAFRDVEIRTTEELPTISGKLLLVHPWIRTLLGPSTSPPIVSSLEKDGWDERAKALQLAARLRQEFGALLLNEGLQKEYRRVAADTTIRVQLLDDASISRLLENVCVLDVA